MAKQETTERLPDISEEDEALEEYRLHVMSRYDEYLQATEKRGASWGEIAYVGSLSEEELQSMEKELDEEALKIEQEFNSK